MFIFISSDFGPCASKGSGVLDFVSCISFASFLFILWVWRFSVTHHYSKHQRESHEHFSGIEFFFILTFICLLSALSGHLPTHAAWPVSRMEDVGFGRSFCRISYCLSSILSTPFLLLDVICFAIPLAIPSACISFVLLELYLHVFCLFGMGFGYQVIGTR